MALTLTNQLFKQLEIMNLLVQFINTFCWLSTQLQSWKCRSLHSKFSIKIVSLEFPESFHSLNQASKNVPTNKRNKKFLYACSMQSIFQREIKHLLWKQKPSTKSMSSGIQNKRFLASFERLSTMNPSRLLTVSVITLFD